MLLPHAIDVTTPPTATPVSLAEIKSHLVVQHDDDDAELSRLLKAATNYVQTAANVYLMPQTVEVSFAADDFARLCRRDALELPLWPLRSVSSVSYTDADGDELTWAADERQVWTAHRPPLVAPAYGESWPTLRCGDLRAIRFACAVGYANAAAVPEEAKHPIRLIVAHGYGNKGDGKDPSGELGVPPAAVRFIEYMRQDFYR